MTANAPEWRLPAELGASIWGSRQLAWLGHRRHDLVYLQSAICECFVGIGFSTPDNSGLEDFIWK
jgi:hypothetical protein